MKLKIERVHDRKRKVRLVTAGVALVFLGATVGIWKLRTRAVPPPPPAFEDDACRQTYLNFYRNPEIDVKVVFGYKDARPARFVADRYERMIFIQRLTAKCTKKNFACEFVRSKTDADLLTRKFLGPDGRPRTLFLRAIPSSVGPDDEENRIDPFQKWRTRYANLAFLQGLTSADAVIYNGHSRAGGGPDFSPPRLGKDLDVDFPWYRKNEPGFTPIVATLEGAPSKLKLLGLYSCASSRHFLERVRKVKPDLGLITSPKLIYFADALESSIESVSSLLAMKCEGAFRSSLTKARARASGAEVSGFFEEEDGSG
jgi:hypothetical protein